jgi:hypothetical protein
MVSAHDAPRGGTVPLTAAEARDVSGGGVWAWLTGAVSGSGGTGSSGGGSGGGGGGGW